MKKQERDFDKEAATWDDHPARVKLAEDVAGAITRQVALTPDMEVLDFGCGTGLLALRIAPLVRSVTGADSSRGMLEVLEAKAAKQGLSNISTRHLDAGSRISGAYDLIVSSMTFHHVEHVGVLLGELFQALKVPGCLCVADLDSDGGRFHEDNGGVFHFGFGKSALGEMFRQAGFAKVRKVPAAKVDKPDRTGKLRKFSIFLMIGEKSEKN